MDLRDVAVAFTLTIALCNLVGWGGLGMGSFCTGDPSRREILRMSAVLAGAGTLSPAWLAWAESQLRRTPGQVRGPFYPVTNIWTRNLDLTRPRDASGRAS